MKRIMSLIVFVFGAVILSNAQKITVLEGDLKPLKEEKSVNIKFVYDDMQVGQMTEEEYLNKKVAEFNEKEAGRGDRWRISWNDDRAALFEPKFIELFNKSGNIGINNSPQKYTMIFHTIFTEPGFNVGVVRANASINAIVSIVETENPDNLIAKVQILNAPGRGALGFDFATGPRIMEAYAAAGKQLAKTIQKVK